MSSDLHNDLYSDIDGSDLANDLVNGDAPSNNPSVDNSLTDLSELLSRSPPLRTNQSEDGSYDQTQTKNVPHPSVNGTGGETFEDVVPSSTYARDAHFQEMD